MCLYRISEPKIAEEDIEVCKVLKRAWLPGGGHICLVSPFYTKEIWEIGVVKTNTEILEDITETISAGFYHSYRHYPQIPLEPYYVYKAVIPKGTLYYRGLTPGFTGYPVESYASRSLKIVEIYGNGNKKIIHV